MKTNKTPGETLVEYLSRTWGGTKWKCGITGEEITLPSIIYRGDFFQFGESFLDVGDQHYSRAGGNPIKIEDA